MLARVSVTLAIASAILFGVWKFGIGQYRGRVSPYAIVLVTSLVGIAFYLVSSWRTDAMMFAPKDVLPGTVAGICALIASVVMLKAFQRGKLGVVAGIGATSGLVPLAYSFLIGEELSPSDVVGIVVIALGITVFFLPAMRRTPGETSSVEAIVLALVASLFWGLAIVLEDRGSRVSIPITVLISLVPQILFSAVMLIFVSKSFGGLTRPSLIRLAGAGAALAMGNVLFFTAANLGNVGVVSVLTGLAPLVVAVLALMFLRERMARSELVAMGITIAGAGLLAI
jgi:drug/metabolite transporter (DMT)-like permease